MKEVPLSLTLSLLSVLVIHSKTCHCFVPCSFSDSISPHHNNPSKHYGDFPFSTVLPRRQRQQKRSISFFMTDNDSGKTPSQQKQEQAKLEADRLYAKAQAIRASIPSSVNADTSRSDGGTASKRNNYVIQNNFALPSSLSSASGYDFRLYVDVGREEGTWMDPRWGASGRRVEFTLDISFAGDDAENDSFSSLASKEVSDQLIKATMLGRNKSAFSPPSSPVYKLTTAPFARLRGGFDKMAINPAVNGYYIDNSGKSSATLRFCISVDGINEKGAGRTSNYGSIGNQSFGDVSIPRGYLYFALPYFGIRVVDPDKDSVAHDDLTAEGAGKNDDGDGSFLKKEMALSTKEGTVTVKQMGWHTGWYREESRILGVFRAVSLKVAKKKDKF